MAVHLSITLKQLNWEMRQRIIYSRVCIMPGTRIVQYNTPRGNSSPSIHIYPSIIGINSRKRNKTEAWNQLF